MGSVVTHKLPRTQSKKENCALALFTDSSGCCLLSALRVFSCSSSVNNALCSLSWEGSFPHSAWGCQSACPITYPLHRTLPLDTVIIQRWVSGHQESATMRIFLGVDTQTLERVYFSLKMVSWKNINQKQLTCPEGQACFQWKERKLRRGDRPMEREQVLCTESWLLALNLEA